MRHRQLFVASILFAGAIPAIVLAQGRPPARPTASAAPAAPPDAPTVGSVASFIEQFHWGINHLDVARIHNQAGGILDQDYNGQLAKMQPGVAMQSVESEREAKKVALTNTFAEFKDVPLGYDRTGIKDEYTYKNHESLMYVDRAGKRRYFFFMGTPPGERLWKIYDEIPLVAGGAMGRSFQEAVTKVQVQLNAPGRLRMPDPAQGVTFATVDWQDGSTHLRLMDRSAEASPVLALVVEDRGTLGALATLRANKPDDLLAIDPSITAVTRGVGRSDPNAARASASASAKPAPKH